MSATRTALAPLVLAGALLATMAGLGGSTAPDCQPVTPDAPVCLTPLDCEGLAHDLCAGAWACVNAACAWQCEVPDPGCGEGQACAEGFECTCVPPHDCPYCDMCVFTCLPAGGKCRSDLDCWPFARCDFTGTPEHCGLIMAPTLPPECWGKCQDCNNACPAIGCPPGQYMDPCSCKCLAY
jgi:hypothetical protein